MTDSVPQRKWLVSTEWLAAHIDAPDIVVVDASWHLPGTDRNGRDEYLERRIPDAVFFDIDEISDDTSDLPHMLPNPIKFAARMRTLGIGDGMRIVVYDALGMFSAPRVWWTFRIMGCDDVVVLDGGLPKWIAEDRPLEDGPPRQRTKRHFTTRHRPAMVRNVDEVSAAISGGGERLLDARPSKRFNGEAPEPRAGLSSGHMPGAANLPASSLTAPDGTFLQPDALREKFENAGIDLNEPVVTTCGSGVTAAILTLGLAEIGHTNNALYDGSWSEWGARDDLPIEKG